MGFVSMDWVYMDSVGWGIDNPASPHSPPYTDTAEFSLTPVQEVCSRRDVPYCRVSKPGVMRTDAPPITDT